MKEELYRRSYILMYDDIISDNGEEVTVPTYDWFKELVKNKNNPLYKYVNIVLREYKLERILNERI